MLNCGNGYFIGPKKNEDTNRWEIQTYIGDQGKDRQGNWKTRWLTLEFPTYRGAMNVLIGILQANIVRRPEDKEEKVNE